MVVVEYRGARVELAAGETVLAALERAGVAPPRGCRRGMCGACVVRVTRGVVPAGAPAGLPAVQAAAGAMFACLAKPTHDLVLDDVGRGMVRRARVVALDDLSADVKRVRLVPERPLGHAAGQYAVLVRPDGVERAYSLASLPSEGALEFHVRRVPGGAVSGWIFDGLGVGESVTVRGPLGTCCYVEGRPEQPLLLVGTGTGLAPLWGIVRDALARSHTGDIALYHGARTRAGLYLEAELADLAASTPNLRYVPCVLEGTDDAQGPRVGPLEDLVLEDLGGSTAGRRVFLCGDAPLVRALRRRFFLAGAASRDLFADPFEPTAPDARSMARGPCT